MKVSTKSSKFLWVGNAPSLDFVNTDIVQAGRAADLLTSGSDLLQWLHEAGFHTKLAIKKAEEFETGSQMLEAARRYRQNLRSAVQHIAAKGSVPTRILRLTNGLLAKRNHWLSVVQQPSRIILKDHWIVQEPADVCVPVAHSFAHLVGSADLTRIRKCKNPECVLFFYDTSKSATRAWCSLDICGNKLRVAAFRDRSK
jgi:predicted RNA-binding Zn ribbon-like protein